MCKRFASPRLRVGIMGWHAQSVVITGARSTRTAHSLISSRNDGLRDEEQTPPQEVGRPFLYKSKVHIIASAWKKKSR